MNASNQYAKIYPDDAVVANQRRMDAIDPETAGSLPALFAERIGRSPDGSAYQQYVAGKWKNWQWRDFGRELSLWRRAFAAEKLGSGERVAIRLRNCVQWVLFDQGAMGAGLVVVPVFAEDRADNIAYIIEQTESRILLLEDLEQWKAMEGETESLESLQRIILLSSDQSLASQEDGRLVTLDQWMTEGESSPDPEILPDPEALATVVFTSGTTGKPKGVMLSHANIVHTAYAGLQSIAVYPQDRMLSFLPLSHMFERTIGCYLNVTAGSSVAFSRSIADLLDDMVMVKPSVLITVPRIFERAYSRINAQLEEGSGIKKWLFHKAVKIGWQRFEIDQGRATWSPGQWLWPVLEKLVASKVQQRFGGNLRFVVSGGAPLAAKISRVFIGLGIDILQGYGLTETSPVLTVNTLASNKPDSIGLPLANASLRIGDLGELQAAGSSIMMGYWKNPEATAATMTEDGWLKTGDIATISRQGFISITGRIKEIIVLANGEKIPPADMESAICDAPVFEQAMIIGEGRAYLSAIVVIDIEAWNRFAPLNGFKSSDQVDLSSEPICQWAIDKIATQVQDFPGYANIRKVTLSLEPWTIDNGALTPTLKIKRPVLKTRFSSEIEAMYEGH